MKQEVEISRNDAEKYISFPAEFFTNNRSVLPDFNIIMSLCKEVDDLILKRFPDLESKLYGRYSIEKNENKEYFVFFYYL